MLFGRKLILAGLTVIAASTIGSSASACGQFCGLSGLSQTAGYAPLSLAIDIYTTTTTTTTPSYGGGYGGGGFYGRGYGGFGGGFGGIGLGGNSGYGGGSIGLYGNSWGVGGYGAGGFGGYGGGFGGGIGGYGGIGGIGGISGGYGGGGFGFGGGSFGFGFASIGSIGGGFDVGCTIGYCSGGNNMPYFGDFAFNPGNTLPWNIGFGGSYPYYPGSLGPINIMPQTPWPGGSIVGQLPGIFPTTPSVPNIPFDPVGSNPYIPPGFTPPVWGGCNSVTNPCSPVGPVGRNPFPIPVGSNPVGRNPFQPPAGISSQGPVITDPIRINVPRGAH